MTKEVFIALIQKDIRELDMITQGLYETEILSPTILKLASSKAQEVVDNLQNLSDIKPVEAPTPIKEIIEIAPPVLVEEKKVIKEIPEKEITIKEEIAIIEEVIETPTLEIEEEKKTIAAPEQKSTEKVIITKTETKIEGVSKAKGDSFASTLANKKITDLKQAINIADRFRFQREIFSNDAEKMNQALSSLNSLNTFEEAENYLKDIVDWKKENETIEDFMILVKRLFV